MIKVYENDILFDNVSVYIDNSIKAIKPNTKQTFYIIYTDKLQNKQYKKTICRNVYTNTTHKGRRTQEKINFWFTFKNRIFDFEFKYCKED